MSVSNNHNSVDLIRLLASPLWKLQNGRTANKIIQSGSLVVTDRSASGPYPETIMFLPCRTAL